MDRYSYLNELNLLLLELPKEEREAALDYFDNYFKNHRGVSEEEIIKMIGTPLENANRIKRKFASDGGEFYEYQEEASDTVVHQKQGSGRWKWLWGILLILTFPVWLPLGIFLLLTAFFSTSALALLIIFLGICAGIFSIISIILVIGGIVRCFSDPILGITIIGIGFVLLGASILVLALGKFVFGKVLPALSRRISSLFRSKKSKRRDE